MLKTSLKLLILILIPVSTANASILGPTYPAPGGNDWTNTGGISGASGTAVWDYSNFDNSAFDTLYLGLDQVSYGTNGAGLDNTISPFSFSSASGQTATWTASTTWYHDVNNAPTPASLRLVMTVAGIASPWVTDLASIGLDDTGSFGTLGAVIDNSAGVDFTLSWKIEADIGSGWQSLNSVPQSSSHNGWTRTNFATGFYYTMSSVPEPTTLVIWSLFGFVGTLGFRRRVS